MPTETSSLPMGKGCHMRFLIDDSVAKDSKDNHWTETTYDGQPDSWVPAIGSHWHKHHDEYMEVLEGRIDFTLEGKAITLNAGDPELHIPRMKVHSFRFVKGVKTVFTEKTIPAGDFKEKFFRELLKTGKPSLLSVGKSFYDGDAFISLPLVGKAMDENFTWLLSCFAKWWSP